MNSLYVGIGTAIVIALVTALIGPFFVDWSAWRGTIESEARRLSGIEIHVLGEIDARLLPSPRLRLSDVVLGDVEKPFLRSGRLVLDLDPIPLLKGEIRLVEVGLDRPDATLALTSDGRIAPPSTGSLRGSEAAIDRLSVTDGRLTLVSAEGASLRLDGIHALAAAPSVFGPWKAEGRAARDGGAFAFRLASGTAATGDPTLRLALIPDGLPFLADLDLRLGSQRIQGKLTLEQRRTTNTAKDERLWRVAANVAGTTAAIDFDDVALTVGREERETSLTGSARLRLGTTPNLDLSLEARRIDFDAVLPPEAGERSGRAVVTEAADRLSPIFDVLPPGRVSLAARSVELAGTSLQEIRVDATHRPGSIVVERLSAKGPGRSSLDVEGGLRVGKAYGFDGRIDFSSERPDVLTDWWSGRTTDTTADAAVDGADPVRLSGRLRLDDSGMRSDDLRLSIGPSELRIAFDHPISGTPGLDVTARRLDLIPIARFIRSIAARVPHKPDLAGLALALHFDTVVLPGATAGRVDVEARVDHDALDLQKLEVGDLAGVAINGSGRLADPLGRPKGSVELHLAARTLGPALAAITPLFASDKDTVNAIARGGDTLAPLWLDLTLAAHPDGDGLSLRSSGTAAERPLRLNVDMAGNLTAPRDAEWTVSADLGDLAAPGATTALAPSLHLTFAGRMAERARLSLDVAGAVGRLRLDGRVSSPAASEPRLDGSLTLDAVDASILGTTIGRPIAALASRIPLQVATRFEGSPSRLRFSQFAGTIADTRFDGEIEADASQTPVKMSGKLHLDRLDTEIALDLALGTGADTASPLNPAPLLRHVGAELDLTIDRVELDETRTLDDLSTRLTLTTVQTRMEHLTAGLADGRLALDVTVSRPDGGPVSLNVQGGLDAADVASLTEGTPIAASLAGLASLHGRVSATGRTAAALSSGLGGDLTLSLEKPRLAGLSPALFTDLLKASEGGTIDAATLAPRLEAARSTAYWSLERFDLPVSVQGGALRLTRSEINGPTARLTLRGSLGLTKGELEGTLAFEPTSEATTKLETTVSKARPTLAGRLSGTLAAPKVDWDIATLATWSSLFHTEKAIAETEALEKEIARRRSISGTAATPTQPPAP